ncbi:MAG: hypothetical protein CK424_05280 [Legionella sp.]|nr:MAG: hypothetical protein CK424_05280 [Legionella sp.]
MSYIILFSVLLSYMIGWTNEGVDVHGLNESQARQVLQFYAHRVRGLEMSLMKETVNIHLGKSHPKRYQQLIAQKKHLLSAIKRRGHFAFVDVQTVYYPKNNAIYTTIEIIPSPNSSRMRFLSDAAPENGDKKQHDLIEHMRRYTSLSMQLLLTHQLDVTDDECPFYHCVVPFHHPQLQPYLALFRRGVLEKKPTILNVLAHDPDPARRAAAAFLVGFFSSSHEIVAVLSAHVTDPDREVRNSVLRVLAATMEKAHCTTVDPEPYLALLDSPYGTDRNKALLILHTLADSESGKKVILQKGGHLLVQLLHLTQPNNHDLAYLILKKISQEQFGAQQVAQWTAWVSQHQEKWHETTA